VKHRRDLTCSQKVPVVCVKVVGDVDAGVLVVALECGQGGLVTATNGVDGVDGPGLGDVVELFCDRCIEASVPVSSNVLQPGAMARAVLRKPIARSSSSPRSAAHGDEHVCSVFVIGAGGEIGDDRQPAASRTVDSIDDLGQLAGLEDDRLGISSRNLVEGADQVGGLDSFVHVRADSEDGGT
jgi:hypothetical protein